MVADGAKIQVLANSVAPELEPKTALGPRIPDGDCGGVIQLAQQAVAMSKEAPVDAAWAPLALARGRSAK
eukprot:8437914-Pyramimonas_sp.AAC.1